MFCIHRAPQHSFDSTSSRKTKMDFIFFSPTGFAIKNEGQIALRAALCY